MKTYPVWRFHQEKMPDGLIVRSAEEDASLGVGWVDSPAKFVVTDQTPVGATRDAPESTGGEPVEMEAPKTRRTRKKSAPESESTDTGDSAA